MKIGKSGVSDDTVLIIQEVFNLIKKNNYEDAFFLSSQVMKREDKGDQLFHEWVKSLTEFYACDKKKTAIELLEKVKPKKPENEIHFRIFNTLIIFYAQTEDYENFIKNTEIFLANYHLLKDGELLIKIFSNICNGYYDFEEYKKSLEYCEKNIKIAQEYKIFDARYFKTIMIKIMDLYYLGEKADALELKENFDDFLKITDNLFIKDYIDKDDI
ncbi:hypothetical protein PV797_15920 [Clostridiaceae bacterium M8S5]|nr:hypothetical protein PV797_15920 [Clostridiaceae bacterium M8S5]